MKTHCQICGNKLSTGELGGAECNTCWEIDARVYRLNDQARQYFLKKLIPEQSGSFNIGSRKLIVVSGCCNCPYGIDAYEKKGVGYNCNHPEAGLYERFHPQPEKLMPEDCHLQRNSSQKEVRGIEAH